MADKKISQLTSATTPLDGSEVTPIVQSGTTVKVPVSEFVNSKNTFLRLQTSNGSSGTPVTQDGFIFQTTSSAGRAGFKFTNRTSSNGSQTLEAWSSDTSNTYAMRWRIDETAAYQWGPGTRFTYDYGNLANPQSNHYKISAGNNGLGFATSGNTQWLNFFNLNQLSSPDNIARIEVTATSTSNTVEAGYMSIYTRSGAGSTAPLETIRFGANGDVTASRGNLVIGTSGKGIDFSANTGTAGATKEVLDWYEEGTWTPTASNITGTNTYAGTYTRIGNRVYFEILITTTTTIGMTAASSTLSLPIASGKDGTCAAANRATGAGYSNGLITGSLAYPPTAGPSPSQSIVVSGSYRV